jgi:hypothetical protein
MSRDEILNMPAGREMDVTIGYHVMGLVAPPEIYPEYSTDIAAAWEIVAKHPHYFQLVRSNETGWRPSPWGAMLWRCRFYAPEKFEARAETAPLAICRAALLAVMEPK